MDSRKHSRSSNNHDSYRRHREHKSASRRSRSKSRSHSRSHSYMDSRNFSDRRSSPFRPKKRSDIHINDCGTSRSITVDYSERPWKRRRYVTSPSRSRSSSRSPSLQRHSSNDCYRRTCREKPTPSRCIGVFGLNVATSQRKIRNIFSKFGPIEHLKVIVDVQTGLSRGFCFIYYKYLSDARRARNNCFDLEIDNRRVRVDYSITERAHTPTPGIYKGRPTRLLREERRLRSGHYDTPPQLKYKELDRHREAYCRCRRYNFISPRPYT